MPGLQLPSVATSSALIVCRRFSAWSNTMLAGDSNTSPVTSRPVAHPGVLHHLPADDRVRVVERRQAVHELRLRVAGRAEQRRVHLVGRRAASTRSSQTSFGSPIDTHTSVCTKSTPATARATSSVIVIGRTGPRGDLAGDLDDVVGRGERCGTGEAHVGAHQRAHHQQRPAHVEAAVADERVRQRVVGLAARLVHREEVGQHLGRVPLVGQAVVDGHAGVLPPAPRRRSGCCRGTRSRRTSGRAPGRCRPPTPCGRAASPTDRGR